MQMADMDAWTTREAAGTDAGEPAYLLLDGVTKRYSGQQAAVDDLHLALPRGKLLGLLGPSGCGKTTTLRMIAGLLSVTSGHIRVSGDDISNKPPHQRDIGLVFQNYALFPHMSAAQNVAFGLEMRGVGKAEIQARVDEALEMVRLPGYGSRRPGKCPAGSSSGWRWLARWSSGLASCCLMSPCPTSTPSCATRCGSRSATSSSGSASPRYS